MNAKAAIHLLVVEGNTAESRAEQVAAGGLVASEGYAALLRELCAGARTDIVCPADGAVTLPAGRSLADYDGAVLTGSALHLSQDVPAVHRQVDLARALLAAGVAIFGSCWGLQVLNVAAGGAVRRNPRGREFGIARNIAPNEAGRAHMLYRGKPEPFSALTVHLDEVETLAPGARLLASNRFSHVQAVDFCRAAPVWGVQYHPEYALSELAAIARRIPTLPAEGFFADLAERDAYAARLDALARSPGDRPLAFQLGIDGDVLDRSLRTREIANWIEHGVHGAAARRMAAAG